MQWLQIYLDLWNSRLFSLLILLISNGFQKTLLIRINLKPKNIIKMWSQL